VETSLRRGFGLDSRLASGRGRGFAGVTGLLAGAVEEPPLDAGCDAVVPVSAEVVAAAGGKSPSGST
jgi:hypothetical protein